MDTDTNSLKMLRLPQVMQLTGLKRATLYDKLNKHSPRYDPTFPTQIRLSNTVKGRSAVGFVEKEIQRWLEARIAACRSV